MQIVIQVITSFLNFCTWLGEGAIRLVLWLVQQIQWLGQRFWRMTDSHIHPFYFRKYQSGHQSPHRHLKTTTHKKNPSYPLSKFPALRKVDAWMARSTYLSGYRSPRRLMYLVGLLLLIVLTPLLWWRVGHQPEQVQAGWWDDTWRYRQTVSITNGSGSVLTNFQVSFTLDTAALITAGKLQSNCDDIRVTDINGSVLPIWLETGSNACNTTSTAIWVKSPTIPTTGAVLYVYYGNSQAVNNQNGNAVFEFFDDFSGSSIDSTKWTQGTIAATSGTDFSVSAGNLNGGNSNRFIQSIESFSGNYIAETRIFETTAIANGFMPIGFFASTGNSFGILSHNTTSYYRNDAGWTNFAFNGVGQWSRDKVAVVGTSATYWRTGETTGTATATVTNSGISSENLRLSARYDGSATNQNYVATWDWIFVRKAVATAPTAAAPSNEETTPGSVGYWKFDEGSGTSAGDSSGNGKTGAFLSAPIWKTEDLCVSGKCLAFDNVDDGVSITGENFTSLSDYTMCAWVNPKGAHKNYTGTIMSSGNWNNTHWAVGINQANTSIQTRKADGVNWPTWAYTVPLNQWTHICVTRSGTTITAYANATQVGSPYTGVAGNLISDATNTTIGRETYAGGYFAFNGWIDEPKIYPYARTAAQIKADYSAGKAAMATSDGNQTSLGSNTLESGNNLANGLVGYWKMDETAANSCTGGVNDSCDSAGNLLDGAWAGNATFATGKFGNGVSFDNAGDVVNLGSPTTLDFGNNGAFTFAGWINPTTLANYDSFISKDTAGRTSPYSYMTVFMADGGLTVYNGSSWLSLCGAGSIGTGTWQHVVFNYDGSTITGYVNGVSCGSIAFTYTDNAAHDVTIGSWYSPNTLYDFHGVMDEVRIYNRALSPAEVSALYNFSPGPVAEYKLDENSGTTAVDSSGNGYNSTAMGAGTTVVAGKFGSARLFNNSATGKITLPDIQSTGGQFVIEAWVNPNTWSFAGSWGAVIVKENSYGMWISNTGFLRCHPGNGSSFGTNVDTAAGKVPINQWTHVACVYNGTNLTPYINGVASATPLAYAGAPGDNANVVEIGYRTAGSQAFSGIIDDVKIYNYARSPAQIIEDMNAGHPAPGSPVGSAENHYKFDEGSDNIAQNSGNSGSTYDGVIHGAGWTNSGKFDKALQFSPNLESLRLNYMTWKDGQTGSVTGFNQNGSTSENSRVIATDPWGRKTVVWQATPDATSGPDGGWNTPSFAIDNTKTYRFSVWVNRKVTGNGSFYLGTNGSGAVNGVYNRSDGVTNNTNPYFWTGTPSQDTWILVVGHIWPAGSGGGSQHTDSGRYTIAGGKIGGISQDFVWRAETTSSYHRSYLYYSTNTDTRQQWIYPRVDVIDGTEPTIQQLLDGYGAYGDDVFVTTPAPPETISYWYDKDSLGVWQHIFKTGSQYFVNGVEDTPTEDPVFVSGNEVYIGRTSYSDYATGTIDDVKLYSTALSSDQAKQEFNIGKSAVLGALSTESDGTTPSFSANRAYCVPGDTATCNPPVAEWKFDENTGTTANDTSGNNNTGSFNGDPIWTVGKNGSALSFDGIDDYVSGNSNLGISGNAAFTMCSWIKWTGASWTANYPSFMGNNSTGATGQGLSFTVNGGRPAIDFWSARWRATNALATNTWYFICGTKVPGAISTTSKIYVNGIEVPGAVESDLTPNITNSPPIIGRLDDTRWFQGIIDNSRFYNYARTPAQIAWEYNQGAPIAHYKFDECQGTTIYNSAVNGNGDVAGNDGTLTIGATAPNTTAGTCATSGAWADGATGKINASMDFDGVDDYTTLGSDITVPKNDSSISWWMKRSVSQYETLFSRLPNASNCMIEVTSTNGIRIESYTNNVWTAVLPTGINTSDGQWHHYTVVFGAANTRLFVDGKLASTGSANTDTANFVVRYFGYKGTTGYGTWLTGQLDDVRIYNYALTADQVQTVYSDGAVSFR